MVLAWRDYGEAKPSKSCPAKPVMMKSTAVNGRSKSISPGKYIRVMRGTCWSRAGNGPVRMHGERY